MSARLALVALILLAPLTGCAQPRLSVVQIDALHARTFDAPPEVTFVATTNALVDMGYHVTVSDGDGGVLQATRRRDPSIGEHLVWMTASAAISLGNVIITAQPDYFILAALFAPDADGARTIVRYEVYKNGAAQGEEQRLEELWIRIERRLLTAGAGWDADADMDAGANADEDADTDDDEDTDRGR